MIAIQAGQRGDYETALITFRRAYKHGKFAKANRGINAATAAKEYPRSQLDAMRWISISGVTYNSRPDAH